MSWDSTLLLYEIVQLNNFIKKHALLPVMLCHVVPVFDARECISQIIASDFLPNYSSVEV